MTWYELWVGGLRVAAFTRLADAQAVAMKLDRIVEIRATRHGVEEYREMVER